MTEGKKKSVLRIFLEQFKDFLVIYIDCISGHIRNSRRCGECNCYLRRDHDERGSWNDTDGNVDYFIAGVGTGGTLSGTGEYLKQQNKNIKVVAVEPATSPVISKGVAGPHKNSGYWCWFHSKEPSRCL